jgi:hypothetical protein
LSNDQEGGPVALQLVRDEDRLVLSSPRGLMINVLRISNDLLLPVTEALPRDASIISDVLSDHPLPLINCIKGMTVEEDPELPPNWFRRTSSADISILGADAEEFGLYLVQHRSGKAITTLEFGDDELGTECVLVTEAINSGGISLPEGALPSGGLVTRVAIDGTVLSIDELQFYNESLKSYLVVISKALGSHVLCETEGHVFQTENCSFIGCFALMDVLLVAKGDIESARRLLDLAAEQASLVRDYTDLARAADLLGCSNAIIEALGRRASMALRDDDRNRHLNAPYIPQLAELYCSKITDGKKQANELLNTLLEVKPDARSLREGADIAKRLLNDPDLSAELSDVALTMSYDEFESGSFSTIKNE